VAIGYVAVIVATFLIKYEVTLVDIVTSGKIFSLFMLLVVNGEIASEIDKNQKDIKIINYSILVIVILITIVTTMKFLELDITKSNASNFIKSTIEFTYSNIFWISAFPLIAYSFLDCYIAYFKKGSDQEKEVAKKFLIFVDLTCIFPLVLVYILATVYSKIIVSGQDGIEVFTSGSMAIVLMSSAIATKAVEEYYG
jgi:hypothetical protein